jgi:hypothetical protein
MQMADIDEETRLRVARKMAELTAAFFSLMDEVDQLFGHGDPPKEESPELEDLQGPDREVWLNRVNPRRKLERVTDPDACYLATIADEAEQEATHRDWSGGGGSSDFLTAEANSMSDLNYSTTEEDDDDDE